MPEQIAPEFSNFRDTDLLRPDAHILPARRKRLAGRCATGTGFLLISSQVVLAFQLPFAIIPLIQFTASKGKMGALVSPHWLTAISAIIAAIIIVLNVKLIWDVFLG